MKSGAELLVGGVTLQFQYGTDVVFHRQLAKHRGLLRQVGKPEPRAPVDRLARDIHVVEGDGARISCNQSTIM